MFGSLTANPIVPTTCAHIHLSALSHNLSQLRSRLPGSCGIIAIVKANAYGHGAVEIAKALMREKVSRLGVVSPAEGIALREAGLTADILVLGPLAEEQIRDVVSHRLTPVLGDGRLVPPLAAVAATSNRPVSLHVKVDTGMGRLGLCPSDLPAFLDAVRTYPSLRVEGIMTHLADADGETQDLTERQLTLFRQTLEPLEKRGVQIPCIHAANSAAVVRYPQSHFTMVRPGISLYGYHTLPASVAPPDLRPVLSLHTVVAHLRTVQPGEGVSYNHTFVAKRRSTIAVLPIGYADGYSRQLSNRGAVLIRGQRAPIVGLVCMDMTMIDVTDVPDVQIGDEVVLIGRQGQAALWADQVAEWADTIPYEVLCAIGPRVPRLYHKA